MSKMFDQLAEELFQVLKGSGKILTLYDDNGKRVYDPQDARRMFAKPDKIMLSINEDGSNSEVKLFLSQNIEISSIEKLINTLRHLATRFNVLFSVRKYSRELSPKDFAYQSLPESLNGKGVDLDYYMQEGCGIFAMALSQINPPGFIGILVNRQGEKFSRSIPYEVTHVYYKNVNNTYDVKGARSIQDMANDFVLHDFYTIDGISPEHFMSKYLGNSDQKPLYGTQSDINDAINIIRNDPNKYVSSFTESIFEALTGTTRTSYQRFGSSRLIVRHSAPVNEEKRGSRARNINALFVETKLGERFKFPIIHLSGARAWAQHLNQGGSPSDDIGQYIVDQAYQSANLSKVSKHILHNRSVLDESALDIRDRIKQKMYEIRCSLGRLSRQRGYLKEIQAIDFSKNLNEDQSVECRQLGILLGISEDHPLAESLMPIVLLTKGENMNKSNQKFHRVVALENADDLVETLVNEYGYKEGSAWRRNNKGISFFIPEAFDDAKSYLDLSSARYKVKEDMPVQQGTDKVLAYAQKWVAKVGGQDLGHVGDDWSPTDKKQIANKATELAFGLKQLLTGHLQVKPVPAPPTKTSTPEANMALKIGQLLAPQAGLSNDMLHNYLSSVHEKLGGGESLTPVEKQVATKAVELVNNLTSESAMAEDVWYEDANADEMPKEFDMVSTPMGPGTVFMVDPDGTCQVELQNGKSKSFHLSDLKLANPDRDGMGRSSMRELAELDEWFANFDPIKFLKEEPVRIHLHEFEGEWVTDMELANYISSVLGDEASENWLDGEFLTQHDGSEDDWVDDANTWLHSNGVGITLMSVDFTNQDEGPEGVKWQVTGQDKMKITKASSSSGLGVDEAMSDLPAGYDSWRTQGPSEWNPNEEKDIEYAQNNFDLHEFFEKYGSDFSWKDREQNRADPEDMHITDKEVTDAIEHYLARLANSRSEDGGNIRPEEFEHDAKEILARSVKPAMEKEGYIFGPGIGTGTDESVGIRELPPAHGLDVIPGDVQHDFRADVTDPRIRTGVEDPHALELARLRRLAGL